jgi:hypothetical protein
MYLTRAAAHLRFEVNMLDLQTAFRKHFLALSETVFGEASKAGTPIG